MAKKTIAPEWLTDAPEPLKTNTVRLLARMGALKKPTKKMPLGKRTALHDEAQAVDGAWRDLQRDATTVLGAGRNGSMSVSQWRAEVWRTPEYRAYNSCWSWFRQRTPEYRSWKKRYDRRRNALRKLGAWERAKARDALWSAVESLAEATARPSVFSDEDKLRIMSTLSSAYDAYARHGHWCPACEARALRSERTKCASEPGNEAEWFEFARQLGRESTYDTRFDPPYVGEDPGTEEIEGVSVPWEDEVLAPLAYDDEEASFEQNAAIYSSRWASRPADDSYEDEDEDDEFADEDYDNPLPADPFWRRVELERRRDRRLRRAC